MEDFNYSEFDLEIELGEENEKCMKQAIKDIKKDLKNDLKELIKKKDKMLSKKDYDENDLINLEDDIKDLECQIHSLK